MSESCPNCGLGFKMFQPSMGARITVFQCGSCVDPEAGGFTESAACELIRSLREELRVAKLDYAESVEHAEHLGDKLNQADLVNDRLRVSWREDVLKARDAERDLITDWLDGDIRQLHSVGLLSESAICKDVQSALRNNEHRSNG